MQDAADYQTALNLRENCDRRSAPGAETISCTVELFGVARLRARTRAVALELPREATLGDVFSALAERLPSLVGCVIAPDRTSLARGHACNINGRSFVRDSSAKIMSGDRILLISADAGG
ncbi:MAG TPA: MoaD/ThiS family protein [Candidatus Binatia bacterium]|nr:MoaD/ThiS family protein [Candidatus Binatia bacterium]HXV82550.1 MoaD/ThiS family protein [Candidatus Binatia bacterium]